VSYAAMSVSSSHGVVIVLRLCGRHVADRLQYPSVIEPVDPLQRRELDGFEGSPGTATMDDLSLVQTVDRLGQSIVVAVADAAN